MSKADVNPSTPLVVDDAADQPEDALTLAQELIRKMDEESSRKMEHIPAEDKAIERGVA
jgi:hypothetical protein